MVLLDELARQGLPVGILQIRREVHRELDREDLGKGVVDAGAEDVPIEERVIRDKGKVRRGLEATHLGEVLPLKRLDDAPLAALILDQRHLFRGTPPAGLAGEIDSFNDQRVAFPVTTGFSRPGLDARTDLDAGSFA